MKFAETLKIRAHEMKTQLTAVYYAYQDKRVNLAPKIIIGIAILYALSPIDLIPDFIPIIGLLDDFILIPALIGLAIRLTPTEVMRDAQKRAKEEPIKLKKNWAFGVVFISLWMLLLYATISKVFF